MVFAGAVVERAMKLQETILRALSGSLTWVQAADILDLDPRTLRRWRARGCRWQWPTRPRACSATPGGGHWRPGAPDADRAGDRRRQRSCRRVARSHDPAGRSHLHDADRRPGTHRGGTGDGGILASAEAWDPVALVSSALRDGLNDARTGHTATLLPSGDVVARRHEIPAGDTALVAMKS